MSAPARYLSPYITAARRHGAGFDSLLWASPKTQELRFDALLRSVDVRDRVLLDVGCGRGDLIDFLRARRIVIREYIGVEAIPQLIAAAWRKCTEHARIIESDFVRDVRAFDSNPDVILFSGSLNTLDTADFYATLTRAFAAAQRAVAFNFLCSPLLAGRPYLTWHSRLDVAEFARTLSPNVREIEDYLQGDCTIAIEKTGTK